MIDINGPYTTPANPDPFYSATIKNDNGLNLGELNEQMDSYRQWFVDNDLVTLDEITENSYVDHLLRDITFDLYNENAIVAFKMAYC